MFSNYRSTLLGAAYLAVVGCATHPAPETTISEAAGLSVPVAFRSEGGPIDLPGTPTDTLTISHAVERAIATDPGVQGALARVRLSEAEATQARLFPNPIMSVLLRFPTGGGRPEIEAGLTADFISLIGRPRRVSAADSRVRAQTAEALGTVLDLLAEVRETYSSAQVLEALLPVLEERGRLLDRWLNVSKARLDAGEGTRLDVTAIRAQGLELRAEVSEKRLELEEKRLTLARLLGEPSKTADWKLAPWTTPELSEPSETCWIEAALKKRPEVQAQVYELRALGAEAKLSTLSPFDGATVGAEAERDDAWAAGPSISFPFPIFDWGQGKRAAARARVIEARHALLETQRTAIEAVRRSIASVRSTTNLLRQVRTELVPLQEERQRDTEEAYRAGSTDVTALIIADQDMQAARAKLLELESHVQSSLVALERTAGGPIAACSTTNTPTAEGGH